MKKEAIVGINSDGIVRAIYCIDSEKDETTAAHEALRWTEEGRTVKRCSQNLAFGILNKLWIDEK